MCSLSAFYFKSQMRAQYYGGLEGTSSLIFNPRLLFSIRDFYFHNDIVKISLKILKVKFENENAFNSI